VEAWPLLGPVANERMPTYVKFRHPLTRGVKSEEASLSSQAGWNSHVVGMNFLTYYSTRYSVASFTQSPSFARRILSRTT